MSVTLIGQDAPPADKDVSLGSCQKKALRDFEKPSFEEIVSYDPMMAKMLMFVGFKPSSIELARLT